MFIEPCIIVIVEEWKTNLMSLASACKTSTTQHQPHQISKTQRTEVCKSRIHITKYINNALITKQPMKNTTHKRTQWSQSVIDSGQYQLKYTYQLQQSDKTHTTIHRKFTLTLNHPSLQNKTTDAVIQQHSRKLLMMDILMSETCWAHKKWNKIASDIKLVFHSSTIIK